MDLAPQIPDSKGGTLLLNYHQARQTYDECRLNKQGLNAWTKDVVDRCVKKPEKK